MSNKHKISLFSKKFFFVIYTLIISVSILVSIFIYATIREIFYPSELPPNYVSDFIVLLPGPLLTDIILIYIIPLLSFLIIKYISPITTLFYAKFHKLLFIFRKKPEYGIYNQNNRIYSGKLIYRLLFASFLAVALAVAIVQAGTVEYFKKLHEPIESYNRPQRIIFFFDASFLASLFFVPLAILILVPLWILEDSGLIAYRIFPEKRKNPDIEGIYKKYKGTVEYFVGFSIIIVYILMVYRIFNIMLLGGSVLIIFIILIFLPFTISGLIAIPIFFYKCLVGNTKEKKNTHSYYKITFFESLFSQFIHLFISFHDFYEPIRYVIIGIKIQYYIYISIFFQK